MIQQTAIERPEGATVVFRRMKFPFEDNGFDRYWHAGSPFKSLFWTQLSSAFAPGEKFFIDSARALKSEIKDQALLDEIAEFCRQEGHHTAQHLKFDRKNEELGIDVAGCRARYTAVLDWARKELDPMEMLGATSALEHFTAALAEVYLRTPEITEGADPGVTALWRWHSVEEMEHKATCFDMYRQLGGSEIKRMGLMWGAWFLILSVAVINTFVLLRKDKKLFTRDTLRGFGYLFGRKGVLSGLGPAFFQYLSPRFHPFKHDTSKLIEAWKATDSGYITHAA